MSRDCVVSQPVDHRFPRVSGDEPMPADTLVVASLFSPRERG